MSVSKLLASELVLCGAILLHRFEVGNIFTLVSQLHSELLPQRYQVLLMNAFVTDQLLFGRDVLVSASASFLISFGSSTGIRELFQLIQVCDSKSLGF